VPGAACAAGDSGGVMWRALTSKDGGGAGRAGGYALGREDICGLTSWATGGSGGGQWW
jgi:hypothetical protein